MQADSEQSQEKQLEKIRRKALALLTRRDHSAQELKQKLSQRGFDNTAIDTVILSLKEHGLQDDGRFAENYAHYRRARGYGPRRIAMELQTRGVAEPMIAEQVKITDNAWFTEIRSLWRKQFKGRQPADHKERARQMRFLYNRGFTQEQINSLLKNTDGQNEY